jgi:outer membrane protein
MSRPSRKLSGLIPFAVCLALFAGRSAAQDESGAPPPPAALPLSTAPGEALRLSLEETIQRALAASARLGQLRSYRDGAEAELSGARAERLPQVNLTALYTRYSNVPELSLQLPPPVGTITIFPDIPDNYSSRLAVSVPVFTGGRLSSLVAAAGQDREAAARDVDSGSQDLVLETSGSYWSLVTALENEKVLQEALSAYDAHLKDARNRENRGLAAKNEVLAVQVERDHADLALVRAGNDADVLRADLGRLLDLPYGTRVEPTAGLDRLELPREQTPALVQEALTSRPERAALKARIEAADARAHASKADRYPQARFSAGYDYANPNRRIFPYLARWQDTWDASVVLSFRVFDSGRTAASIARSTAEADAARHQLEDLDRKIEFEVTRRLLELSSATAAVDVAEKSLESARENKRVAADRYRAGVIPSSELLDSEVALLRAGLERTEALAGQHLALAALQRALGR